MKITYCKLKQSIQKKLLEFFVAEVTARTAANLLDIQPNTAALFYHKIRLVIGYHLSLEVNEIFEVLICPQKVRLYSNFIQGLSSVFHRA